MNLNMVNWKDNADGSNVKKKNNKNKADEYFFM